MGKKRESESLEGIMAEGFTNIENVISKAGNVEEYMLLKMIKGIFLDDVNQELLLMLINLLRGSNPITQGILSDHSELAATVTFPFVYSISLLLSAYFPNQFVLPNLIKLPFVLTSILGLLVWITTYFNLGLLFGVLPKPKRL